MRPMFEHQSPEVQAAIVRLADALCTWERTTSIESVLIIRESNGFVFRALSGKPNIADDIPDADLVSIVVEGSKR